MEILPRLGASHDSSGGFAYEVARVAMTEQLHRTAALDDGRELIRGEQQRRGTVAEETSQIDGKSPADRFPSRQIRNRDFQHQVGIPSDGVQAEILDEFPQDGTTVEPIRQLAPQCRADIADRLIGRHPVEHDGPELRNPIRKVEVVRRPQSGHDRGATVPMACQQVLDQVVPAPRGETISRTSTEGGCGARRDGDDDEQKARGSFRHAIELVRMGFVDQMDLGPGRQDRRQVSQRRGLARPGAAGNREQAGSARLNHRSELVFQQDRLAGLGRDDARPNPRPLGDQAVAPRRDNRRLLDDHGGRNLRLRAHPLQLAATVEPGVPELD